MILYLVKYLNTHILQEQFVHQFSGGMALDSAISISLSYFLSAASMIYAQHLSKGILEPPVDLKYPEIFLFLIGISGNFYHHYLLSKLRTKGDKEYRIPNGSLFDFVICPHFLFEIIDFLGISFMVVCLILWYAHTIFLKL